MAHTERPRGMVSMLFSCISVGGEGRGWEQPAALHRDEHLRHSLRVKTATPQSKGGAVVSSGDPHKQSRTRSTPPPAFLTKPLLQIPENTGSFWFSCGKCFAPMQAGADSENLTLFFAAVPMRNTCHLHHHTPHLSDMGKYNGHHNRRDNLYTTNAGLGQPAPLCVAALRTDSPTRI